MESIMEKPTLIIACGNPDAGDDAFGYSVAKKLRTDPLPGMKVIDLGTRPTDLLADLQEYAALIIVDAVLCPGEKPGAIIDTDWFDPARPALINEATLSSHGMSIGEVIYLSESLGMLPSIVRLLGVNIGRAEIGGLMTQAVQACVADVARIIRQDIPGGQKPAIR
jgi:hydrogenase maturation protease